MCIYTPMTATKKKMSPLKISLILHTLFSYLSLITTLPITSKPLENNPEHLTWEAWLMIDSKNPHEKARKITPKSIFITPILTNTTSSVSCPDGYKIDHNNQCIQIVNINQDEDLLNHLESFLGPSEGHEGNYDYSDYDSAAVHAGPFQLNIPLNLGFIGDDPTIDDNLKGDFDYDDRDGEPDGGGGGEPRPDENVKPFRDPTSTDPNEDDKLSVLPIRPENETTGKTTNRMGDVTKTEEATTTDIAPENETKDLLFEQNQNNSNTEKNVAIEMVDNGGSNDNIRMGSLKQGNENIAAELQKESFLFDVNDTAAKTTTTAQQATTLLAADDDGFTTEEAAPIETTTDLITTLKSVTKKRPTTMTTTTGKSSTKEKVVVVTPSNRDTLKVQNESNLDKINREKLEKHEQKEDAVDNIDTRNRFVYHHLGNEAPKFHLKSTTEPPLWHSLLQSSTTTTTTTDKTVLEEKISEQVKAITRIIEENNRMKVPTASESQIDKRKNGFVRFPGPTSQRLMAATTDTTPPTDAESDGKWWLSSNWSEIESNYHRLQQHQPTPASSAASLSSTPFWKFSTNRGNSKSPTEHLYEEQRYNHDPIYRVLTSKSLHHHHNNR